MRAIDHYTFFDTIKIPPNTIWNKYKILKISFLPHPTPEHTEGLHCSVLTKALCLLKLWKPNSFMRGSSVFFFPIRTTKPRTRICFPLECCFSMSRGLVGLHATLWKEREAQVACTSPTRLYASTLVYSSAHLTPCLCCPWIHMWARMAVSVATKGLCFRALGGE